MVRIFFSMAVWVLVAQWLYNEAQILTPGLVPYIDAAFSQIQIPTHDTWDTTGLERMLTELIPEQYRSLDSQQALNHTEIALEPVKMVGQAPWVARPQGYEVF